MLYSKLYISYDTLKSLAVFFFEYRDKISVRNKELRSLSENLVILFWNS